MSDNSRKYQPLLNSSVIGGTVEDYSQFACLLPPAELPPPQQAPPITTVIETDATAAILDSNPIENFNNFGGAPQQFLVPEPYTVQGPQNEYVHEEAVNAGPLQTVFSSFSSLLNIKKREEPVYAPPVLNQEPYNAPAAPIPFYNPQQVQTVQTPPAQSTANTYRRAGIKRPVYAQIPGLTSERSYQQQQPTQNIPPFGNTTENSLASYFQPTQTSYTAPHVPYVNNVNQFNPGHQAVEAPQLLTPVPAQELFIPQPTHLFYPTEYPSNMTSVPDNEYSTPTPLLGVQDDMGANVLTAAKNDICVYQPVVHHWFYRTDNDGKSHWTAFSKIDSAALETAYLSSDLTPDKVIATDGGRYDVNILRRERNSVYWNSSPSEVRRSSWFHKGTQDGRYVPYEENVAVKLEEEFRSAVETNTWNRKVELPSGEVVIYHGADVLVLFPPATSRDTWGNNTNQTRPRVIRRGIEDFCIDEGEPATVDHLLFMIHGIGSVCDLSFRSVEQAVDEFRSSSLQLLQAHYNSSSKKGVVNRVEVLPISWHEKLHSVDTGVDDKLKSITLESIPKLRHFANDTILDVLFYTSPFYCQTIISSVGNEMNRIYNLFKLRNPSFGGGVSLGGHSLGSLILFDILCHQSDVESPEPLVAEDNNHDGEDVVLPIKPNVSERKMSRRISYMMGNIGTGQPQLNYPHLAFKPKHFFALGSPIGMFVTVRGLDTLGESFALPTCPAFFNIFHPYDPVAYRIESLVNHELAKVKPILIPHHKGRKRMHLELKETMARVGADLKQKLLDSMKSTWSSFYQFSIFNKTNAPNLEEEVDKVLEGELQKQHAELIDESGQDEHTDLSLGILNQGRRVDYVLQEAPLEFINEYIFALASHVCYWQSEDTMLFMLKEIYGSMDISADCQIPQQDMTIERPTRIAGTEY